MTTDEQFERAWKAYPKRAGGNSKADALRQWNARLRAGVQPEVMYQGVLRYGKWCDANGQTGTVYVKMASTFFGRGLHFEEAWEVETPKTKYYPTPEEIREWASR